MADVNTAEVKKPQPQKFEYVSEYMGKVTRRSFLLSWAGLAWSTFTLGSLAGTLASARFMFPNVLFEPPPSFKVGKLDDFAPGVDERFKQSQGIWIIREQTRVYALLTVCTHLGCTPNWLSGEAKFKCPCHGSGFRMSGVNFEGPAPRPLERAKIYIDPSDGQIIVDKSKKFQYEKGQWDDKESFIDLS